MKTYICILVILGWHALACQGQQLSPLAGQGVPSLETTEVYLSAFLDRLLEVDAAKYMHESQFLISVSWKDPTAAETVQQNTEAILNGSKDACDNPCWNNVVSQAACCDDIYVPSFKFTNDYGFTQDRQVVSEIYLGPGGEVLRVVDVLGMYYQPMTFENFPFESMDLIIAIEFLDTSYLVPGHPGVNVIPSASSSKVYKIGNGDDSPDWNIDSISLVKTNGASLLDRISYFSSQKSAEGDLSPLAPNKNQTSWFVNAEPMQMVAIVIKVSRFWQWNLISGVLPILDPSDLGARLSVVVTLFLALTAVQFVLSESMPRSSYVLPLQQIILVTYLCLTLSAMESILAYRLFHWKRITLENKKRKDSFNRYKKRMKEWRNYRPGHPSVLDQLPDAEEEDNLEDINGGIMEEPTEQESSTKLRVFAGFRSKAKKTKGKKRRDRTLHEYDHFKPTITSILAEDSDYGPALAHFLDLITLAFLSIAYVVLFPVLLATQSGFSPIFEPITGASE
eukprot:jgi/Picsp_1/5516/NSC_02875-R1_ligand-gated ion channel